MKEDQQAGFLAHFETTNRSSSIDDAEIRFINQSDTSDSSKRKNIWIDILKTRYPQGLNNN